MDPQIVAFIIVMPMKLDAVACKAAGDKPIDGLAGGFAGGVGSGGDTRLRHQQDPFC